MSAQLNIQYISIDQLSPQSKNPRTHTPKQIGQIADSIRQFGFTNPILIDRQHHIIAGHGRLAAARKLGINEVPTIRLENLSEAELRAYVIADNRLAEHAGWDEELLAIELQGLMALDPEFDVELTGFEMPEIDLLIGQITPPGEDPDDHPPAPEPGPSITRPGDLWQIGPHWLLCGDALDANSYARLLGGAQAQCVFTDPPYNVPIDGHVSGLGKVRHREFEMAAGEMSRTEFSEFLTRVFGHLVQFSVDGSIHFICMDWRHIGEVLEAAQPNYADFKNLCVWAKSNGGMGSLYRSQHELVFVFKAGKSPHINNVELGRFGRYRTNVWQYAGINAFGPDRDDALEMHPTVKPVALVADALLDCSARGGIVLDAFAGSGTTLVAAERTGRRGYGLELDPHYCDVILRRLTALGLEAAHSESEQSFEAVGEARAAEEPNHE